MDELRPRILAAVAAVNVPLDRDASTAQWAGALREIADAVVAELEEAGPPEDGLYRLRPIAAVPGG